MFLGQYQHNLDDKGRLTIPSAFRQALGAGAFISQGFDHNLMVMNADYFGLIYDRLNSMNITDPDTRLLRRLMLSSANQLDLDKSGRILVAPRYREFLAIDTEVIVVGQGEYFEIWSPSEWELQVRNLLDTEANARRFSMFDLSLKK